MTTAKDVSEQLNVCFEKVMMLKNIIINKNLQYDADALDLLMHQNNPKALDKLINTALYNKSFQGITLNEKDMTVNVKVDIENMGLSLGPRIVFGVMLLIFNWDEDYREIVLFNDETEANDLFYKLYAYDIDKANHAYVDPKDSMTLQLKLYNSSSYVCRMRTKEKPDAFQTSTNIKLDNEVFNVRIINLNQVPHVWWDRYAGKDSPYYIGRN